MLDDFFLSQSLNALMTLPICNLRNKWVIIGKFPSLPLWQFWGPSEGQRIRNIIKNHLFISCLKGAPSLVKYLICYFFWEKDSKQNSNKNTCILFSRQACNLIVFCLNVELNHQLSSKALRLSKLRKLDLYVIITLNSLYFITRTQTMTACGQINITAYVPQLAILFYWLWQKC